MSYVRLRNDVAMPPHPLGPVLDAYKSKHQYTRITPAQRPRHGDEKP